jgi:NADH-quinone oxidoreductase subunit A
MGDPAGSTNPWCHCLPSGSDRGGGSAGSRTVCGVTGYLGSYASLGILLIVGVVLFGGAFAANRVLSPRAPDPGKLTTYESGVDPVGGDWAQAQIRYYVYAYLYVLFAVESVFLFPWALVFDQPGFGTASLIEMAVFLGVLLLGLLYAWRKGVLHWT